MVSLKSEVFVEMEISNKYGMWVVERLAGGKGEHG